MFSFSIPNLQIQKYSFVKNERIFPQKRELIIYLLHFILEIPLCLTLIIKFYLLLVILKVEKRFFFFNFHFHFFLNDFC